MTNDVFVFLGIWLGILWACSFSLAIGGSSRGSFFFVLIFLIRLLANESDYRLRMMTMTMMTMMTTMKGTVESIQETRRNIR